MTLLVRDEQDIIVANLEHHLAQGVDHVVVTDNLSVDGTRDLLEPYRRAGVVSVLDEPADDYAQAVWVTRMAQLAAVDLQADWVINNDADEFWWPRAGSLATTLADTEPEVGVLVAHRSNFVPVEPGPADVLERMVYRQVHSTNPLGQPLPPKVCHRASPAVQVAQGNHAVHGVTGTADDRRIEVLHFPVRSYAQLENKIRLGGQAYRRNTALPATVGATWRRLLERWEDGGLPGHYAEQALTPEQADRDVAGGTLVLDTRLRDAARARRA